MLQRLRHRRRGGVEFNGERERALRIDVLRFLPVLVESEVGRAVWDRARFRVTIGLIHGDQLVDGLRDFRVLCMTIIRSPRADVKATVTWEIHAATAWIVSFSNHRMA